MILIALFAREAGHVLMSPKKASLLSPFEHSLHTLFWTFPAKNMVTMAENIIIGISALLVLVKESW